MKIYKSVLQTPDKAILHTDDNLHLVATTEDIRVKSETKAGRRSLFSHFRLPVEECVNTSGSPSGFVQCVSTSTSSLALSSQK